MADSGAVEEIVGSGNAGAGGGQQVDKRKKGGKKGTGKPTFLRHVCWQRLQGTIRELLFRQI